MQNSRVLVYFYCFRPETPFLGKFGPKNQNCHFKLKFVTKTNSSMQNSMVVFIFFCFRLETPFLGKFGPKNQNFSFKLKFGTYTNSNMQIQWWCLFFSFFFVFFFLFVCFRLEIPLMGIFGLKNQNCQFNLKFVTRTKSYMQNSMVVFTFSVLYRKHSFWQTKVNEAWLLSLSPYGSIDFEIGSCRQHGLYILLWWMRSWIVFGHCLKEN